MLFLRWDLSFLPSLVLIVQVFIILTWFQVVTHVCTFSREIHHLKVEANKREAMLAELLHWGLGQEAELKATLEQRV